MKTISFVSKHENKLKTSRTGAFEGNSKHEIRFKLSEKVLCVWKFAVISSFPYLIIMFTYSLDYEFPPQLPNFLFKTPFHATQEKLIKIFAFPRNRAMRYQAERILCPSIVWFNNYRTRWRLCRLHEFQVMLERFDGIFISFVRSKALRPYHGNGFSETFRRTLEKFWVKGWLTIQNTVE